MPIRGSLLLLFLATALYLMTTLGMGLFISTVSATQQQAMMSTFFFYFPAVLLSGFMFPIANMPAVVQWLTYLNPLALLPGDPARHLPEGRRAGDPLAADGRAGGHGRRDPLARVPPIPEDARLIT